MAKKNDADKRPAATKALPGSAEAQLADLRARLDAALEDSGLLGECSCITDTFPDAGYFVACSWEYSDPDDCRYFRIPYTVDAYGEIMLGAAEPVVKVVTEALVTPATADELEAGDSAGAMGAMGGGADGGVKAEFDADSDTLFYKSFDLKADLAEASINGVKGWTFEGYITKWGVVDAEGDVTVAGCYDQSIADYSLPLVKYEHGPTIGVLIATKADAVGQWVRGFVPDMPDTAFIRALMKIGAVAKMSYGWKPYPNGMQRNADGTRTLSNIRLYEVSPVAIPMLDATAITAVKGGLLDGSLSERIAATTRALYVSAVAVQQFANGRKAAGRKLGDDNLEAIATLGAAAEVALYACAESLYKADTKSGRAIARSRWQIIQRLKSELDALIESIPEGERADTETDSGGKSSVAADKSAQGAAGPGLTDDEKFLLTRRHDELARRLWS